MLVVLVVYAAVGNGVIGSKWVDLDAAGVLLPPLFQIPCERSCERSPLSQAEERGQRAALIGQS